jgi:double-stranded uracil-DNA glycosylase
LSARRDAGLLRGFGPIAEADARLLILGSMPGGASLAAGHYYAHPRNAFWDVIEAVWGVPRSLPYEARIRAVRDRGIAIWDVVARCHRATSLDADIKHGSVVANDFARFFGQHRHIRHVAFNGAAAEALFRRHVQPVLPQPLQQLACVRMPSTSPAHASLSIEGKIRAWKSLRRYSDPAGHRRGPSPTGPAL